MVDIQIERDRLLVQTLAADLGSDFLHEQGFIPMKEDHRRQLALIQGAMEPFQCMGFPGDGTSSLKENA